jgi:aryl-alcohol dehydrogenase-like predicted oxidoreductase
MASMGSGRTRSDARALIAAARDHDINFIDTADTYGSTAAERWIGDLTLGDQQHWVVTTKTGLPTVDLPGPFRVLNQPAKKLRQARRGANFALDPTALARSIDRSLRRLRRAQVEIFLLHLPPEGVVNNDEIFGILREAKRTGKIAEFGISSDSIAAIRLARDAWGCTCTETGIDPLGQPELSSGALGDLEIIANHVMGAAADVAKLPQQVEVPGEKPRDVRRRLLRHAAATPGVRVVLTGTSSPEHLRENVSALEDPVTASDLIV